MDQAIQFQSMRPITQEAVYMCKLRGLRSNASYSIPDRYQLIYGSCRSRGQSRYPNRANPLQEPLANSTTREAHKGLAAPLLGRPASSQALPRVYSVTDHECSRLTTKRKEFTVACLVAWLCRDCAYCIHHTWTVSIIADCGSHT